MKQFGKILKFELKGYMRNKVFVGITIFLVVAIAIVMFIPNIMSALKSDEDVDTAPTDLPVMLIHAAQSYTSIGISPPALYASRNERNIMASIPP